MLRAPSLTLALEEEYQFVDPVTRSLEGILLQRLTAEETLWRTITDRGHNRTDEVGPPVPRVARVADLEELLAEQRARVAQHAAARGWQVLVAGTHPFTIWGDPEEVLVERFRGTLRTLDDIIPHLLFFSLNVQVGVEDRNLAVDIMDVSRYMMPHVLAVAASSPLWQGENTGLKSFRATLMENVPRSGMPDRFRSWSAYRQYVDSMLRTNSMADETHIWWDVRVHPRLPVLEFRICDANPRQEDVLALVALFQSLVAWLWDLRRRNLTFRLYHGDLIKENRWRAARYGLDTNLVDFGKREELAARSLVRELLHLVMPYAQELECVRYLERIYTVLERGTSADRQLEVFSATSSPQAVVEHLIQETSGDG